MAPARHTFGRVRMSHDETCRAWAQQTAGNTWVAVVDDDWSVRSALARCFRAHDVPVETFVGSADFLAALAHRLPACAVFDIDLGETSGFELYDRLVALGVPIPVIFISGSDTVAAQLERRGAAERYLRKPFDTDALVQLARSVMPAAH